jgi:hypothetical protein
MVIVTTTLTGTSSVLGGLGVIMALKITDLDMNVFFTSIFLGHFPYLYYALD